MGVKGKGRTPIGHSRTKSAARVIAAFPVFASSAQPPKTPTSPAISLGAVLGATLFRRAQPRPSARLRYSSGSKNLGLRCASNRSWPALEALLYRTYQENQRMTALLARAAGVCVYGLLALFSGRQNHVQTALGI